MSDARWRPAVRGKVYVYGLYMGFGVHTALISLHPALKMGSNCVGCTGHKARLETILFTWMFFTTHLFRVWWHGPNCKGGVQEARCHDCLQIWSTIQPIHQLVPLQTQFLTLTVSLRGSRSSANRPEYPQIQEAAIEQALHDGRVAIL